MPKNLLNSSEKKWYQKNVSVTIILIIFFPIGLYLMWKHKTYSKTVRIIISGIFALLLIGNGDNNENTDQSNDNKVSNKTSYLNTESKSKDKSISITKEILTETENKSLLVRKVQKRLKDLGYNVKIDGIYGNGTKSALRKFQNDNNLQSDGILGKNTYTELLYKSFENNNEPTNINISGKNYNIVEIKKGKKGGSINPVHPPKYIWIKAYAALKKSVSVMNLKERDIKITLKKILSEIRDKHSPDAVNIWLYTNKEKDWRSTPIGTIDWWPKNHSLSRSNAKNIINKATYVTKYEQINLPEEYKPTGENLTKYSESERKNIFKELVLADDRALEEADEKYPITGEGIPIEELKNIDWDKMTTKHDNLVDKLQKKYVNQVLKKYSLTKEDEKELNREARKENWAWPELKSN